MLHNPAKFTSAKPLSVLVLEHSVGDTSQWLDALKPSIEHCHIESVSTAAALTQALTEHHFDVLLLDLANTEGFQRLTLALSLAKNTPIIVICNADQIDLALSALRLGATDYLVKNDFGHNGLARSICYALSQQKSQPAAPQTNPPPSLADKIFDSVNESILITNINGVIESVNPAFMRITGYSAEEVIGKTPKILRSAMQTGNFYQRLWRTLSSTGAWQGETWNQRKDGTLYPQWISISAIKNEAGNVQHYVSIASDLTAIRQEEQNAYRLARFDVLTGLLNRDSFHADLTHNLATAKQEGFVAAIIILNLKRFRDINDARGMEIGDRLLKAVARRIKENVHKTDILARLGSDEFSIILPNLGPVRDEAGRRALGVTERLLALWAEPFNVQGEMIAIDAYFGINLYPRHSEQNATDIMGSAQTALNRIRRGSDHPIAFFEQSMEESALKRYTLERDLRLGIAADQLRLYLQPQFNANHQIVSFEALVRWQHPQRGLVSPAEFIPLAEQSDLIVLLETWMLKHACQLLSELNEPNPKITIAINISPRHFARADLIPGIKRCLIESGVDPTLLILEVTESLFLRDIESAAAKMHELSALGLRFSLDDFGTGYSALGYLKQLSFHELKIDQSFVRDLPEDQDAVALVETILAVARSLNLHVVAEGVENADQAAFLNARGPIIQQGYYHGKPEPAQNWLKRLFSQGD